MRCPSTIARLTAAVLSAVLFGVAQADILLDDTRLVGLATAAAPSEHAFTATAAEALTVTLTDFQTPAAFASLQVAVTLGDTLVGSAQVDATHTGTIALPPASGNYSLRVIGAPDSAQGYGSFGVCVTRNSDPTPRPCIAADSFSGNLQTPSTPSPSGSSSLSTIFTTTVAGTYTVTVTDDAFPAALQSVSALIPDTVTIIPSGTPTPVQLSAATNYQLLAFAVADPAVSSGLYGIRITDPSGNPVFDRTLPVGGLAASTIVNNPTAQSLSLTLTDFAYPAALSELGVAVTAGAALLADLTAAPGSVPAIAAPAGTLEVWKYAQAGSQPGSYGIALAGGSASLLSTTQVVNPAASTPTLSFAFLVTLPAAGNYNLVATDFLFPSPLASLAATIAQNGTLLTQSPSGDFTAAQAGTAVILVNAQPPATGKGIFGVTVATTGATPQVLLDKTQAIGGVFDTQVINVGTAGIFDVTLADLGFPADFQDLAVLVSRGTEVLGKIVSSGTFPVTVTPGQYALTFVATPSAQNYGLYSIKVASSAPTVTFTADTSSVSAGKTVQLTWSSQNATACTASGNSGWVGAQPVAGGTLAVVIDATVTLTLTCTGPGGSATQSLNITATTPPPSGSGGGGAMDLAWLGLLSILIGKRMFFRPVS